MPNTLTLQSPAKVNLFLRILSRRPDGYHDLASLFHTLSLCDTLTFRLAADDSLTCDLAAVPTDGANLILKATQLFRERTNTDLHLAIQLSKRIPMQAGLGGGSSNAATTLWACNQMAQTHIPDQVLADWGAELGSDVPFFLSNGCAYVTGRGEAVQSLAPIPPLSGTLYKPNNGCSTPAVYQALDLAKLKPRDPIQSLADFQMGHGCCYNDLEAAACVVAPELDHLRNLLQATHEQVVLCGSGSAFFGLGGRVCSDSQAVLGQVHTITRQADSWYT